VWGVDDRGGDPFCGLRQVGRHRGPHQLRRQHRRPIAYVVSCARPPTDTALAIRVRTCRRERTCCPVCFNLCHTSNLPQLWHHRLCTRYSKGPLGRRPFSRKFQSWSSMPATMSSSYPTITTCGTLAICHQLWLTVNNAWLYSVCSRQLHLRHCITAARTLVECMHLHRPTSGIRRHDYLHASQTVRRLLLYLYRYHPHRLTIGTAAAAGGIICLGRNTCCILPTPTTL